MREEQYWQPPSRSARLIVRVTVWLLFVAHFYYDQQRLLMPKKVKAKGHSKNIVALAQNTHHDEKVNKFYVWGDPTGINITSLLSYYEWLTLEGIRKENWGFDNMPLVPVWISKDPKSKRFIVKISMASFNKIPNANYLWRDRAVPMLNFMVATLNDRPRRKHRKPPRRDVTRLFQLLEQAYDIPFLLDFGDTPSCGDNVFSSSSIVSRPHKLHNLQLPLFEMCRPQKCNYSFPLPTFTGLGLSKISTDDWDNYFQNSDSLYPWKSKTNAVVWRGGPTGLNWTPNRTWLVEQSISAPSVIDAKFSWRRNQKHKMSFQDFQKFKAVIDIDGNGWSGRFHGILCMNSVALKIRPQFLDYNAGQLKEWFHYIPYDLKNVSFPDFVENILEDKNDAMLRKIVSNARAWCRQHMSRPSIQDDLLDIFASFVAELDKNDPTWEHKWMPVFSDVLDAQTIQ